MRANETITGRQGPLGLRLVAASRGSQGTSLALRVGGLVLLVVCLLAVPAAAQTVACGTNQTAGTLVAKGAGRGLVLASPRVLDGNSQVFVRFGTHVYGANVLAVDRELDAAMLEIAEPASPVKSDWQLCAFRGGQRCPLVERFIDRFRPRCGQPAYGAQPTYSGQPTFSQPAQPYAQQLPAQTSRAATPAVDNRTPVNAAGQPCPGGVCPLEAVPPQPNTPDSGPAAPSPSSGQMTLAERATLERNHAAAMQAKAAEIERLKRQLAAERAETEKALAAIAAHKANCPGVPVDRSPGATGAPLDLPAAAGDVAGGRMGDLAAKLGTGALTKVLVFAGLPAGGAAVGAAAMVWLARRRVKRRLGNSVKVNVQNDAESPATVAKLRKAAQQVAQLRDELAAARRRLSAAASNTTTNVVDRSELQVERVPTTDHEFLLLQEAMAREVRYEPKHAPIIERIQSTFAQLKAGAVQKPKLRAAGTLGWADKSEAPKEG